LNDLHDSKSPAHHDLYEAYRSYVRHEDSLVDSRLSWNLTVQGFLFAGYSVLAQKAFETCSAEKTMGFGSLLRWMWALAALGMLISLVSLLGVLAANSAIRNVRKLWEKKHTKLIDLFPPLTGGGVGWAEVVGMIPQLLPLLFCFAWAFIVWTSAHLTSCPAAKVRAGAQPSAVTAPKP
jgi:hypothetical protein